jgi:hypothetical protein
MGMELHTRYLKKGLTLGPCDFPCTDDTARKLEADLKDAEKDGYQYTRSFVRHATKEFVEGERADISVIITDDTLDHENEVILPKGLDVEVFRKNPVVVFPHNYQEPPVGRCEWLKHAGEQIKAKTKYAERTAGFRRCLLPRNHPLTTPAPSPPFDSSPPSPN